jgi:hypothetical protein
LMGFHNLALLETRSTACRTAIIPHRQNEANSLF